MSPEFSVIPTDWECRKPHRSGVASASLVKGYKLPCGPGRQADQRIKAAMDVEEYRKHHWSREPHGQRGTDSPTAEVALTPAWVLADP